MNEITHGTLNTAAHGYTVDELRPLLELVVSHWWLVMDAIPCCGRKPTQDDAAEVRCRYCGSTEFTSKLSEMRTVLQAKELPDELRHMLARLERTPQIDMLLKKLAESGLSSTELAMLRRCV